MVRTAPAACPRWRTSYIPRSPGTDLKVLGFYIGAQVARGSTMPAGRVFSLQATRLVSSTRRPVGLEATPESREPTTWPGSCGSGAPQPDWSRAIRYLYHNERHLIGLLTICSSRPLPGSALAWIKAPRCPTHRLWGGDDGLYRYTARQPYSARRRTSRRRSPQGAIAGEPGTRAPHVAVTFGGREISTIETCTDGASCCFACRGQWRGVDLSCGACNAAPWRTALDVCISLRCGAGRC
jgi:putative polyketide hydroxylase